MSIISRIEQLESQLHTAQQIHAAANADLRKAKRKADRAEENVKELKSQIAYARLEAWGDNPDLATLLDPRESSVLYEAAILLANRFGLCIYSTWADTNQLCLSFGMRRIEAGAVERLANGIRYFAPAIKRIKGGWARFLILSREDDYAWHLRFSPVRGNAQVVKLSFNMECEVIDFVSLELALAHIEKNLWVANVIDAVIDVPAIEHSTS
ncbi:hypothetical protein V8Z74_14555 [Comamonas sp. w2-DMI]|uniref:hypothetical protein n=1 Tax=Comamonas sp. w2-DMI TaxID=3126391 RepID=UPI0032E3704D